MVRREARFGRRPITTTQFPQSPGMGESWDPKLVQAAADVEGYEARFITQTPKYDRQVLMLWGPQSDLDRDPRRGRSEEAEFAKLDFSPRRGWTSNRIRRRCRESRWFLPWS